MLEDSKCPGLRTYPYSSTALWSTCASWLRSHRLPSCDSVWDLLLLYPNCLCWITGNRYSIKPETKKMGIFPKNFDMYFSVLINVDSCSHPIESIFLCDLVQVLYPTLLNKFCALFLYVLPIQVLLECHKIYHPLTKNSRFLFTTFHMKFNPFISAHRVPCFSTSVVSLALFLIFS